MMTDISSETASTAGASTENASSTGELLNQTANTEASNLDPQAAQTQTQAKTANSSTGATPQAATTPVIGADGKVTYVPNYKYKAATQEKEIDPLFHPLIKDADTEKKIKDIFTKIDAFDFVKGKKDTLEKEFGSLASDYDSMSSTVDKFNKAVAGNDLNSAFRLANITKEQVFKWTQQQLKLMDMAPEERQQYEQYEQAQQHKSELEGKVSTLQQQYEHQAVQARTMQLDMTLSRPEVSKFAEAWDQNAGEIGAFRDFVASEARRIFYEQQIDISPEKAVSLVMQRFGKFLNVGDTASAQSPQAIMQTQTQKPVIPHVAGMASSPIKKVVRSLDDIKALAKSM